MGRLSMRNVEERRQIAGRIIEPILWSKRDWKIAGDYKRFAAGPDGRVRTVLSPDTASARLSSNQTDLFPASTNLQNMAKKVAKLDPLYQIRDVIVADLGMVLVAGDYKNAEAILVFAYSEDWEWVDKLIAGKDIHQEHAQHFWEIEEITKLQRDIAKTITYASFYAAKPPTIQLNLNREADVTGKYFHLDEVVELRGKLLRLHPLEIWWDRTFRDLATTGGILRNCLGYRRTFYDPDDRNRLKDALSFYPQSTVAWKMNNALPILYDEIDKPGVREMLHQIHDEALFQARSEEVEYIIKTATPILERPFKIHGRELFIPVEWKVGPSWGQMRDYTL